MKAEDIKKLFESKKVEVYGKGQRRAPPMIAWGRLSEVKEDSIIMNIDSEDPDYPVTILDIDQIGSIVEAKND
jgi:hypothetical protein